MATTRVCSSGNFYPRPPRGGRLSFSFWKRSETDISIHALREEGDLTTLVQGIARGQISIHALREEGDAVTETRLDELTRISIHALREEGDPSCAPRWRIISKFLSTPSARRATCRARRNRRGQEISIHALREEGDDRRRLCRCQADISIHALREEGDMRVPNVFVELAKFLSTPSARRATFALHDALHDVPVISIHALREEGDFQTQCRSHKSVQFLSTPSARRATSVMPLKFSQSQYFYPRPPRGGRRFWQTTPANRCRFLSTPSARRATSVTHTATTTAQFLSTPSARRATVKFGRCTSEIQFLSTPSARRATLNVAGNIASTIDFYPRPPRGGRLSVPRAVSCISFISIHALREEGDRRPTPSGTSWIPFLSTPSARRATRALVWRGHRQDDFYPRPPRGGRHQRRIL